MTYASVLLRTITQSFAKSRSNYETAINKHFRWTCQFLKITLSDHVSDNNEINNKKKTNENQQKNAREC